MSSASVIMTINEMVLRNPFTDPEGVVGERSFAHLMLRHCALFSKLGKTDRQRRLLERQDGEVLSGVAGKAHTVRVCAELCRLQVQSWLSPLKPHKRE